MTESSDPDLILTQQISEALGSACVGALMKLLQRLLANQILKLSR